MTHKHAGLAGTFDHFHAGHRFLLKEACENAEHISIGITEESMTKEKLLAGTIEPFSTRKQTVERYLEEQNWSEKVSLFSLKDIYGIALDDKTLDAIYTTQETVANAQKINELREAKDMTPLEIITVPMLEGDDNEIISSSRIRIGQINREGVSYVSPFIKKDLYTAPLLVRDELRSPIGDIVQGSEDDIDIAAKKVIAQLQKEEPTLIITVGDIVTHSLQKHKIDPDISFIDNRTRREELEDITHKSIDSHGPFKNEAGTLNSAIVRTYSGILEETIHLKEHQQFIIEGEEDLLGLPAIMLAPLNSVVLYGQFDIGIVYVRVTEEVKLFCYEMLQRFV